MSTSDHAYCTATELIAAMDAGTVSAVELTQSAIARIERQDGDINAVPVRDFERALLAARDADAARARGERRPLLGIPMTVKESFNAPGCRRPGASRHSRTSSRRRMPSRSRVSSTPAP